MNKFSNPQIHFCELLVRLSLMNQIIKIQAFNERLRLKECITNVKLSEINFINTFLIKILLEYLHSFHSPPFYGSTQMVTPLALPYHFLPKYLTLISSTNLLCFCCSSASMDTRALSS